MELVLEREGPLEDVSSRLSDAASLSGSVVLVGGEAGVGKSTFVEAASALARRRGFEVLVGACDGLSMPRPLGPVHDIAAAARDSVLATLLAGAPQVHETMAAFLTFLQAGRPKLVIIEDLHWSDAATIDLIRFVGRRIGSAPAVVLATFRDDELSGESALRVLVGELSATASCSRIALSPLSEKAVSRLVSETGAEIDPADLYRRTGGNPFFVTEVLLSPGDEVPSAVREAVLARTARLSPAAQEVIEAASIMPLRAELDWLLVACPGSDEAIDECQRGGVLAVDASAARFRHELARNAVESQVPSAHKRKLHREALNWLRDQPAAARDVARLVHHAVAGSDDAAVLELAPIAAATARALGAHREAAAHLAVAAEAAERLDVRPETLAELLDGQAREEHLADQHGEAMNAQRRSLAIWEDLGDSSRVGAALHQLSRLAAFEGRRAHARVIARQAVAILEQLPPSRALTVACLNVSQLAMADDDIETAIAWAERTRRLAEELGEQALAIEAMINRGATEFEHGLASSSETLESAIRQASAGGFDEVLARALLNLALLFVRPHRRLAEARELLTEGLRHCEERGLEAWAAQMLSVRAFLEMHAGQLEAAASAATDVLRRAPAMTARTAALTVLGRVRARRGDPGVWAALDEAWASSQRIGELQFLGPAAAARLEAAVLLGGDRVGMARQADAAIALAAEKGVDHYTGDIAVWLVRGGLPLPADLAVTRPWSLELDGDAEAASLSWATLGCPYEAASALAWSGALPDDERRDALRTLHDLGATAAARRVGAQLRREGTKGVPRGAHAETRANPAGLTRRQLEILSLMAEGLTNAAIGERLYVSTRTVDHHVTAVLAKLGVKSRAAAVAEALRMGIVSIPGVDSGSA
jgi:DNA-binding CsgD family transcriptional regulator